MSKQSILFALLFACSSVFTASAWAQSSTSSIGNSRSSAGGYTGNEIRNIYRQDIGQGYTSDSLNAISMQNARARVGYFGQSSAGMATGSSMSSGPSLAPGRASKPFSQVSSSPTVSPYLNLFREDFDGGGDFNYQTLVRPQLQQQQLNQQFQRENYELARRVQSISAQSDYKNPAGSESIYPTGHQTSFGYYGSFYPGMNQQQRGR
jgi:hypothetical protein